MVKKLVIVNGSYRNGKTCDSICSYVECYTSLEKEEVLVHEIQLRNLNIKYCTNCKICMRKKENSALLCPISDDIKKIIAIVESANTLLLISPTIGGSATAIFKTFMERLAFYHYWPKDARAPKLLTKNTIEKCLCIDTLSAPGIFAFLFDTQRQLTRTAKVLGCKKIRKMSIGFCYDKRGSDISSIDIRLSNAIDWLLS